MNEQATRLPETETRQTKQTVDSFCRRHRLYLCGLLSGFGFGLFAVEAFRQDKNPLLYIGGLSLSVLGNMLYRRFKDDGL
ncbi:MAG TPA: hypothetical protein VNV43_11060 [Candidatus Acidoferrales bacterium]|jgi:hypothetical protein|nr:hypothetical protein [Candidatus Acidoferrales bacterium]